MNASHSVYLRDVPLPEAWARFETALREADLWRPLESEEVPLDGAMGRVLAEPVWATISSPPFHAAAMDGYAVRALEMSTATDKDPVTLRIGSQAFYLDTGDPVPAWSDAVIPIEQVEPVGETRQGRALEAIRLRASTPPWAHIRPMGEDMVASELVLPAGHLLRPVDLGAIAGCGHDRVRVSRMPRVAIVPTGSELVPVGQPLRPGQIYEYNSLVLASQVRAWGGAATRLPIVADELASITQAIMQASAEHDLILVNAGSSAGLEDFTARVVETLGEVLVHGVAVRPGHPVILGMIRRRTNSNSGEKDSRHAPRIPVIGVPGYPVSAALTGEIFVEPLIARWLGRQPSAPATLEAVSTRKVHSSAGDEEYVRVTVGRVGERWIAAPLSRGAGVITSLVRADGLVIIPAGSQGIQAGEGVTVRLYTPSSELARTILILGSHDLTIDLMAQHLAARGARLTSANLGSLGGLLALQRGEAHVAGSHLLDPDSGEYNLAYVRRYLPGAPVVVMGLALREQGLILPRGNPKGVRGLEDLARSDLTFINRQRGAGTRVLLDYHLDRLGIRSEHVRGYDREEFTHLAVCVAIASGRADTGLGIRAAAETMQLDFLPLFQERYDLVFRREHYESPQLRPLLEVLHSQAFRESVMRLPGYDASPMGKVIAEIG